MAKEAPNTVPAALPTGPPEEQPTQNAPATAAAELAPKLAPKVVPVDPPEEQPKNSVPAAADAKIAEEEVDEEDVALKVHASPLAAPEVPLQMPASPLVHPVSLDAEHKGAPCSGGGGGRGASALTDHALCDEIQEALDVNGATSELIADWAGIEAKALKSPKIAGKDSLLPAQVRDAALRLMTYIAQLLGMSQKSWFSVVTAFDAYCLKFGSADNIFVTLPATCVALVKLLKKMDCATDSMMGSNFSIFATELVKWLQQMGHPVEDLEVTEEAINSQELKVLKVLNWQLNLPTIESWTSRFCSRFNVLTRNMFMTSLNWAFGLCMAYARMIALRQATTREYSPRRISIGLLCISFVHARLLPVGQLCPEKVGHNDWEFLFAESQPQVQVAESLVPKTHHQSLLDLLEVTTGCRLQVLKEDCHLAATLIRDTNADIKAMQHPTVFTMMGTERPQD